MRPIYLAKIKRFMAFPGGSVVKNSPANAGDTGLIPGLGRSPEDSMQPTSVFLPGESQGQRSLVGYSPWGHKESDTTKHVTEGNWTLQRTVAINSTLYVERTLPLFL